MRLSNSEISFYIDTMIVETLLSDHHLVKTAQESGVVSGLISKVKEYFGNHIDQSDVLGSVINFLAPGALTLVFSAIGLPKFGALLGLLARIFNVDTKGILTSAYDSLKSMLGSGKQIASSQVDSIVDQAIEPHNTPVSDEEATRIEQLEKKNSLRAARLLKVAMIAFEENSSLFRKEAGVAAQLLSSRKTQSLGLLGKLLKWLFKVVLASAGLMFVGDVVNKFLGRPNAFDGSIQGGKPTGNVGGGTVRRIVPKQTKFPPNPSYREENNNTNPQDPWIENIANNRGSIANTILSWAKQVYNGLEKLDTVIIGTGGFQTVVETITNFNQNASGGPVVFIPQAFNSKKSIVDIFIDEVAEKAP